MVANKVELPLGGGGSSGGIYVRSDRVFCQWQTWLQAQGGTGIPRVSSARIVMQRAADFLVGGSNDGRANMAAALAMAVDRRGFKPPSKKSAVECGTIRPWFGATTMGIPTACSLLTTNMMPWGMLRE